MIRGQLRSPTLLIAILLVGCSSDDETSSWTHPIPDKEAGVDSSDAANDTDEDAGDTPSDAPADVLDAEDDADGDVDVQQDVADAEGPCPSDMVLVESACVDRYEAPNRADALPLVMYHFDEAASWCEARGKRLCYDDEWTRACAGPEGFAYPYGDTHEPGACNDDQTWLTYNQTLLNGWPWTIDTDPIESLEELLEAARATGPGGAAAADHVEWLYQATPSGAKTACSAGEGAFDLSGNVEEWTRRRSGGSDGFHGNLKGRYWAEARTCQQSVITHGDQFRFYEIGFRCCLDPI